MYKKIVSITVLLFAISLSSFSQQMLSLEECRRLAIENNKTLKIASENERKAYYEKREALMNFFPKVSASGTYLHFSEDLHLISKNSIPQGISTGPLAGLGGVVPPVIPIPEDVRQGIYKAGEIDLGGFWLGGVSLTQPIFMGGKIIAANDLRAYALELARTMKDTKVTDVIVETDEAYWQVVSVANKKKLAESYVQLLTKMDSDVEIMCQEGVATKADRLTVSVKLNEAEMALTKASNGLSLAKMLLSQICGLEIGSPITLSDENIETLENSDTSAEELIDIDNAIANRSEVRSLDLATKIYKKKEKIVLSEFLPTAGIRVGYNWLKPNLQEGRQDSFGGMWNVAVNVSVPLNFVTNSSKLNAAKAETRIKQYEMEEAKEKIKLQINQSAFKLSEANKKMSSAHKNTEKADENLRYAKIGFDEGVIPASDVLGAHTAWVSAHAEMIDAQIDLKLCRIYLNKALGRSIQ